MQLPVVDIVEVGAGGGSIAWCDAAGGIHVGPESAGTDPGPAATARRPAIRSSPMREFILGRINAGALPKRQDAARPRRGGNGAGAQGKIASPLRLSVPGGGARHRADRGCRDVASRFARCRSTRASIREIPR